MDRATREAVTCMACGRLLRDQESRRLRIGPHCLKRLKDASAARLARVRTATAGPHPKAVPAHRTAQLVLEIYGDDEGQDDEYGLGRHITDVPTGALL
ncbi:DUF6011 domain-containing protein [Streptomyces sp. NPDC087844]|uniref:DUF6011 domain-containing protein n=1 Tax=Streptomyces sp. NPDC087844 TaxID=3365805 RepID=UPI00381DD840